MTRDVHHAGKDCDESTLDDIHAEQDHSDALLAGDFETGSTDTDDSNTTPDTVVCCRYCEEEFERVYDYDDHQYTCEDLQHAVTQEDVDDYEEIETPEDINRTYFIRLQWHEVCLAEPQGNGRGSTGAILASRRGEIVAVIFVPHSAVPQIDLKVRPRAVSDTGVKGGDWPATSGSRQGVSA